MKLCRDPSCRYCWGGLTRNHLVDDGGETSSGARRTITGRVVRWARWLAYSHLGAHVVVDVPREPDVWIWNGAHPFVAHVDGALSPRAAERRALAETA